LGRKKEQQVESAHAVKADMQYTNALTDIFAEIDALLSLLEKACATAAGGGTSEGGGGAPAEATPSEVIYPCDNLLPFLYMYVQTS
jgi:hypothetical protein